MGFITTVNYAEGDCVCVNVAAAIGETIVTLRLSSKEAKKLTYQLYEELHDNETKPPFNWYHQSNGTNINCNIVDRYGNIFGECPYEDAADAICGALNLAHWFDELEFTPLPAPKLKFVTFTSIINGNCFLCDNHRWMKISDCRALKFIGDKLDPTITNFEPEESVQLS